MAMSCAARGDGWGGAMVERGLRCSTKGAAIAAGSTRWLGRNLRASGFGVLSVWMKMVRRPPSLLLLESSHDEDAAAGRSRGRCSPDDAGEGARESPCARRVLVAAILHMHASGRSRAGRAPDNKRDELPSSLIFVILAAWERLGLWVAVVVETSSGFYGDAKRKKKKLTRLNFNVGVPRIAATPPPPPPRAAQSPPNVSATGTRVLTLILRHRDKFTLPAVAMCTGLRDLPVPEVQKYSGQHWSLIRALSCS